MPRCGCQSVCSCVVQGRPPVVVTGNGSVQRPYVVSLGGDGVEGCDAIAACLAGSLGPGLAWDEASRQIQVLLSRDDGQVARFGSDSGVLVTNGTGPTPETCTRGIGSLPEAPGVVGAYALAGLINPYSSPYGVDYCVENQCDIIGFQVATTADGVGVVADYWDDRVTAGRSSIYVSQDIVQLTSAQVSSTLNYAGDVDDPRIHQIEESGDRSDRRGGWYGTLAQRYYQPLLGDFLHRISGKAVALLQCMPQPETSVGSEAHHIEGAIRGVLGYCAQDWAMIGVGELGSAGTVLNAGITPVLTVPQPEAWAATELPHPVADVTGAGVQWVLLPDYFADSVFTAYRDAGINVLMWGNSRHSERTRVGELGIRGGYMLDPVYYRGPQGVQAGDYRLQYDPWEHRRMGNGTLTFRTDQRDVLSPGGFVRGYTEASEQGLVLPPNWGGGFGRASVLCGWECPLVNSDNYSITWDMKALDDPGGGSSIPKIGLLFGAETDAEPYAWPQGDAENNPVGFPEGQKTLYRVFQRLDGEIGLAKWESQEASITYLARQDSAALAVGEWNSYRLDVTPTQLTFTRTLPGGGTVSVTATDDQYRGPYFWVEKEESYIDQPGHPFGAKFRNITYIDNS